MRLWTACGLSMALAGASAVAQNPGVMKFPPEQIEKGAELYARHCATCHGDRLANPPWAIDLRTFPRDQHARFVDSVTYGKTAMPPWGDLFKAEEIEALWAYLIAGEK